MKKTNVKKHIRRTKKKVVPVKQHKRRVKSKGKITSKEREIFTYLSDPGNFPIEHGGAMDFDKKGNLESFEVRKGKNYEIELPDYEVLYHTHPSYKESPPTPDDVLNLIESNRQQAEIIFRDGSVFSIVKTPKSKKTFEKLSKSKREDMLGQLFYQTRNSQLIGKSWEDEFKKGLENLGFEVKLIPRGSKAINLNIKPVE